MNLNTLDNPLFYEAEVLTKTRETEDTFTYCFSFIKRQVRDELQFVPGQFNLIDIPGLDLHASIITSNPNEPHTFEHTFQYNPRNPKEYKIVERLLEGGIIKIAGPFGNGWTKADIQAKNLLIVTGGLGFRSIKPMLNYITQKRYLFNEVEVLYSVKTPKDFLYMDEYELWKTMKINMALSVENVPPKYTWNDKKGLIVGLLKDMKSVPEDTIVLMAGPEMMLKFSLNFLKKKQFDEKQIFVSLDHRLNDDAYKWVYDNGPIFPIDEIKEHILKI